MERKTLVFWAPLLLWMGTVLVLSSLPGSTLPRVTIPNIDKIVHYSEYFIMAILFMRAMVSSADNRLTIQAVLVTLFIITFFAAFDEIHQLYIPGRSCDILDYAADMLGAGTAVVTYILWKDIRTWRS
jgi:VanZ family protein